jgi:predicted ATPase/DNA-binding CsgD family transcriptional regulator
VAWAEQAAGLPRSGWAPLTSFVGRSQDVAELTRLLGDYRLVTVTGSGGVGKTRLALEASRQLAGQFPDGLWFVDLGAISDEARVPAAVATVLGVPQDPGQPALAALAASLTARRLLLILDNCEHVLPAVAQVCRTVLTSADDVRILATSREQVGVSEEAPYRLQPLPVPDAGTLGAVGLSDAAVLFTERARQANPRFALDAESAALVARLVARLDGMPLAIELAAAWVEALGLAGLADRIDDALRLLVGKDRLAAARHRSLAAVADWSYHLLAEPEQRVFRQLAVFPGPFTLEAAELVAGADAGPVVLRLVDCSLLAPPRPGTDQRTRYTMLQTLRAYGLARLREAGEEQRALARLAAFAWSVAGQAGPGVEGSTSQELEALRWLDGEDATLSRALDWTLEHDPALALRLAAALAPWLRRRGRLARAGEVLRIALARCGPDDQDRAKAELWLGFVLSSAMDMTEALDCFTSVIARDRGEAATAEVVQALVGRAVIRLNQGEDPALVDDAARALALSREAGDRADELQALTGLCLTAYYAGEGPAVRAWAEQAEELLGTDLPAGDARWSHYILATVLTETGELDAARRLCTAGLALSRQAADQVHLASLLTILATLDRLAGQLAAARAELSETIAIATRNGDGVSLTNLVRECGYQCAAAGRWADAVTLWAARAADRRRRGLEDEPAHDRRRAEFLPRIEQALSPEQVRAAEERGAAMPLSAAVELASLIASDSLITSGSQEEAPGLLLSPREQELVTLVAQGHTNAEIAARLFISVRTVASHLDRIRDKTGYRRRADLTRLAIEHHLV